MIQNQSFIGNTWISSHSSDSLILDDLMTNGGRKGIECSIREMIELRLLVY